MPTDSIRATTSWPMAGSNRPGFLIAGSTSDLQSFRRLCGTPHRLSMPPPDVSLRIGAPLKGGRPVAQPTNWQERIVCDPHILRGKPTIRGTRIPVTQVLNLLEHGYAFGRITEAYPELAEDDIRAALAYAQARLSGEELILLVS